QLVSGRRPGEIFAESSLKWAGEESVFQLLRHPETSTPRVEVEGPCGSPDSWLLTPGFCFPVACCLLPVAYCLPEARCGGFALCPPCCKPAVVGPLPLPRRAVGGEGFAFHP